MTVRIAGIGAGSTIAETGAGVSFGVSTATGFSSTGACAEPSAFAVALAGTLGKFGAARAAGVVSHPYELVSSHARRPTAARIARNEQRTIPK